MLAAGVVAVAHQINAGAVQRDRVKTGQDTHIVHAGILRHGTAVAVDRKVLHDCHIGDLPCKMLCHGGGGIGHSLKEGVLLGRVLPQNILVGDLAAGVDIGLARAGCAADGQLLQRAAVAAHRVALEVDQHQHTVVVFNILTQIVDLEHLAVLNRPLHIGALGIHNIDIKQVAPMMLFHQLDMLGRFVAGAAVGGVALDHCAVHGINDRLHKLGAQVVLVAVLTAVDLDGHLAGQINAQLAVHLHDCLRGKLIGKIHGCFFHRRFPPCSSSCKKRRTVSAAYPKQIFCYLL